MIDRQNLDRCTADGGPAHENRAVPSGVPFPLMPPRVEDVGEFSRPRIDPAKIRPFVFIAIVAREREVARDPFATMGACDDMVDLKSDR